MDHLSGEFSFTLFDFPFFKTKEIKAGTPAKIQMGSQDLIVGYIDRVRRTKSAQGTALEFTGRDKTSDLVDCSAIFKTNSWRKKSLFGIVSDICTPFGIDVTLSGFEDPIVEEFAIQTGETPFAAIERLCRVYSLLPLTDQYGGLLLTNVAGDTADVSLTVGQNIKKIDYEIDYSGKFSNYIFKGQTRGKGAGWLEDKIDLKGEAVDVGVDRYRPIIFVAEKNMTPLEISKRAAWEAQVRAGRAEKTTVITTGWMQNTMVPPIASRPWTINELVSVRDSEWGINVQLLLTSVTFDLTTTGGRLTTLELSPPEIYKADPAEEIELSRRSTVVPI